MKAREIQTGDVFSSGSGNWMVRDFEPTGIDGSDKKVRVKLSAGRTDPGQWYEMGADEFVDVYRPDDVS